MESAGLTPLVKVEGRLNSTKYQTILQTHLQPHAEKIGGRNWKFQQDGASCHRSKCTKSWLIQQNIVTLPWAPYSPDMNIIETLWGYMVRRVYPDGKQYTNKTSLERACHEAWSAIPQEYLDSLFKSMPRRVEELLRNKGGSTSY